MEETQKILRGIRINRTLLIINLLLLFCVFAGVAGMYLGAGKINDEIRPYMSKLNELDVDHLVDTVNEVSRLTEMGALDNADELIEFMNSLDFDRIENTINTINGISDTVEGIFDKVKKIKDFFD